MTLVRLFIISSLFVSSAFGAEMSTSSTVLEDTEITKEKKNYDITLSSVVNSSLHKPSDEDHSLSNELSISPTISLGYGYTFLASLDAVKDFKGERKMEMGDGTIGINKTLRRFGDLTISGTAFAVIPLSESTKEIQQLRTGITLAPKLSYKVSDGIKVSYTPSAKVNFHKFKNSLTGASNTNYQLANTAAINYSGIDSFSFSGTATYLRKFTYRGNTSDVYALTQSVTYLPTDTTSVTLGHSLGASPLQPNGIEQEIKIFDERKSSIFAGFSFTY